MSLQADKLRELGRKYLAFHNDGKAKARGVTESDVPADQLEKGTVVEKEHTPDANMARRIAVDHLAESPVYYKELEKMETKLEHKKANHVQYLTQAERAGCIRMGIMLKLAEHNILPSEFTKSAFVTEIGKAVLGVSLLAGIPVGAAAHLLNRKIVERRGKEHELQEKIKYYRAATQGLERGLVDELAPVKEEAANVGTT